MTYVIIMQPPMLPPGEYTYPCRDDEHLRRTVAALKTLHTEIIDVERNGDSITAKQLAEVIGE